MNRTFLFAFIATGLAAAVACGPSDPGSSSGVAASCGNYYDSLNGYAQRCGENPLTGSRSDFIGICTASVNAPGSGFTTTVLDGCASAVAQSSTCASGIGGVPQCKPPAGKLADGAACGDDTQCASGDCKTTASAGNGPQCGVCAKLAKENEPCNVAPDNLSCGADLKCVKNVCAKNVTIAAGGACSFTGPEGYNCAAGTFCNAAFTPNSVGTCAALPKKGETCTAVCDGNLACVAGKCADKVDVGGTCASSAECKSGLTCDQTKKCAAKTIVKAGESCASTSVKCDAGLACTTTGTDQQTCVPEKKNGEACAPTDVCAQFLVCSGGKCVIDDPALCK